MWMEEAELGGTTAPVIVKNETGPFLLQYSVA